MQDVKAVGDTGAHDRNYIMPKTDIDAIARPLRQVVQELMAHAKIAPKPQV